MNISIMNPPRPDLSEWLTSSETSGSTFEGFTSFIADAFEAVASNPLFKVVCCVLLLAVAVFVIRMMLKTVRG